MVYSASPHKLTGDVLKSQVLQVMSAFKIHVTLCNFLNAVKERS